MMAGSNDDKTTDETIVHVALLYSEWLLENCGVLIDIPVDVDQSQYVVLMSYKISTNSNLLNVESSRETPRKDHFNCVAMYEQHHNGHSSCE